MNSPRAQSVLEDSISTLQELFRRLDESRVSEERDQMVRDAVEGIFHAACREVGAALMSAANDRCGCSGGAPVIEKGQHVSIAGGCCGGKGPGVFDLGKKGLRCTLCILRPDSVVSVVAPDHPLMEEAREWDPDADFYLMKRVRS